MLYFSRQFLTQLLILIMVISPVQVTMAIDIGQLGQAMTCQVSQVQLTDMTDKNMDEKCTSGYGDHCAELSVCGAQNNISSLHSVNSFLLMARATDYKKIVADSDSVRTHYPELLKRPPKI